jgi:hypothetical protein
VATTNAPDPLLDDAPVVPLESFRVRLDVVEAEAAGALRLAIVLARRDAQIARRGPGRYRVDLPTAARTGDEATAIAIRIVRRLIDGVGMGPAARIEHAALARGQRPA